MRLAGLSVDRHDRRLVPLEAQRHHARQRAIDEPQAQPLAGFHRLVGARAAVERHDIANMARHRIVHGVAETPAELAVGIQTPVREHPDEVAIDRDGFPFLDDERAGEAPAELLKAIGVRVVPKRAGVGRGELVGKACAGLDRRLSQAGHAVHGVGQADAVPMNRGVLIEGIGYKDTCRRTLPNAQDRSGCMAIIGPNIHFGTISAYQSAAGGRRRQPILARLCGERGWRAKARGESERSARLEEPASRCGSSEMTMHSLSGPRQPRYWDGPA